jgi:processive 1,2-diacylglycerol beta-glucosyltransferase
LIRRGVDPYRIYITGLPIKNNITGPQPMETGAMTQRLNVLIVIGGRRAGPYRHAAQIVVKALPQLDRLLLPIRVTIVTGANRAADRQLRRWQPQQPVERLSLVDDLPARLSRADIVIGKPGGVLTAEVLASGAAFIALAPGPGQETANAHFLQQHQLALMCDRPDQLIDSVTQLVSNTDLRLRLQNAARRYGRPAAADTAARMILNGC